MYIPPETTIVDPDLIKEHLVKSNQSRYDKLKIEKSLYYRSCSLILEFSHELYYQDIYHIKIWLSKDSINISCQGEDGEAKQYPFPLRFFEFLYNSLEREKLKQELLLKENSNTGMSFMKVVDYEDGIGVKRDFEYFFIKAISDSSRNQAPNLLVCSNETGKLYKISPRNWLGIGIKYDHTKGDRFTSLTEDESFYMKYEEYSSKFTIASAGEDGNPENYFDKIIDSEKEALARRREMWKYRTDDNTDDYNPRDDWSDEDMWNHIQNE